MSPENQLKKYLRPLGRRIFSLPTFPETRVLYFGLTPKNYMKRQAPEIKLESSLPRLFCKEAVLKNICKVHRKTPMMTFSLRKVADLGLLTFGTMSFDYFACNLKAVVLNFSKVRINDSQSILYILRKKMYAIVKSA